MDEDSDIEDINELVRNELYPGGQGEENRGEDNDARAKREAELRAKIKITR